MGSLSVVGCSLGYGGSWGSLVVVGGSIFSSKIGLRFEISELCWFKISEWPGH